MADHSFTRDFSLDDIPVSEVTAGQTRPGVGKPIAFFYTHEMRDEARSSALGRYVPRQVDMVRILIPGDKNSIVERRIRPDDKVNYRRQYEAFKKQQEFVPDGTPIEAWPMISRTQAYELKGANIFTVEDIANLSDEQLPALGLGARLLRKHAKAFLETSEKGQASAKLVSENETLRNQVTLLTNQLGELTRKLETFMVKAGEKLEDASNPVHEIRQELAKTVNVAHKVDVPENYGKLNIMELKKLVKEIGFDGVIATKQDAIEVISDYLAKRDALAA